MSSNPYEPPNEDRQAPINEQPETSGPGCGSLFALAGVVFGASLIATVLEAEGVAYLVSWPLLMLLGLLAFGLLHGRLRRH